MNTPTRLLVVEDERNVAETLIERLGAAGFERLTGLDIGDLICVDGFGIRTRTGEGRARAKANGKSVGRPFAMTKHQRQEALARRESGELLTDIARSYNVSAATISRLSL